MPPRRRAALLHQSAEHEQPLPRLGDAALPRAARGAVVAEELERALYHAGARRSGAGRVARAWSSAVRPSLATASTSAPYFNSSFRTSWCLAVPAGAADMSGVTPVLGDADRVRVDGSADDLEQSTN